MEKYLVLCFVVILGLTACSNNAVTIHDQLEIHDIQGCGHISPYIGQKVRGIIGVVTHKFTNGFTMQGVTSDDQFCSSEAIFVFTGDYPLVMVADLVQVNGLVGEFSDGTLEDHNLSQTEIEDSDYSIIQSDYMLPDPIVIDDLVGDIPTLEIENDEMEQFDPIKDGLDFYESLESMLVEVGSGQVVSPRNAYDEIIVLVDRLIDINLLSKQGVLIKSQDDANPEKIMIKRPTHYDEKINVGDRFENPIIGVMDYSYGNYKLLAFSPIEITRRQHLIEPFSQVSDGLTIATYNVENLSPLDENKKYTELARQIVKYLQSPDVIVLNEIMDNSGSVDDGVVNADKTIMRLMDAIHKAGGPVYSFSDFPPNDNRDGGIEGGNIRTALLYRSDRGISLVANNPLADEITIKDGKFTIGQNPVLIGEFSSTFNGTRKPRIWLLNQNDVQFFVVGVHLTSQGANSPDWGNLQPPQKPEEMQRLEEAQLINEQLKMIHSLNPDTPVFIAGDMNDMPWSNTVTSLKKDGFFNAAELETPEECYSYIFEGNAQELDYILINENLASDILQARFIHVNSFLDQSDAISDHDPMIIEFQLDQ